MKNIIIAAAVATIAFAGSANALTLKKGQVISSGGEVVSAAETATGQATLASDGVLVSGGMVFISLNGHTIEVPLEDLRGKSKDGVIAVIGEAAGEQLGDLVDSVDAHVAEIGENATSAIGKTAEELVADAIENNVDTFVGVSDELHEQMLDQFEKINGVRPTERAPQACDPNC